MKHRPRAFVALFGLALRCSAVASVIASLVAVLGTPGDAFADESTSSDSAAEARQQYQLGTHAFQQKRYSEAALHFEAAASLRTNAVALYTAGLAWDLAGRTERAADAYARALDVGGLDAKQTGLAKDRVAQLERSLGSLVVTAPEGWRVQLDTFTEIPAPARLHGAPGAHTLSIRSPGKPLERREISLEAGRAVPIELKEEPKTAPRAEPDSTKAHVSTVSTPPARDTVPPSFWSTRRVIGLGVLSVGAAALGGAAVLALNTSGAKDAYVAAPTRASFDHASSLQTCTNVALVAGAALAAVGVALVVWPNGNDEPRVRVGFAPGYALASGSF